MEKICITGACGFIGFHLSKQLLEKGFHVIGIDNLNDYYDPQLKQDRLNILKEYENFKFFKCDISHSIELEFLFSSNNFSIVYHLAAQAGVRYSITHPSAYVESNLIGFYNLIECIRKYPVKHFLFASSSSVYGNHEGESRETDNTDYPVSFYAATKKSTEVMAYSYAHLYDIKMTALRFFTVYGPWGRPDMAYYSFSEKMLKSETLSVFSQGELLRDFTYIDDVVNELVKLMNIIPETFEIYNIGNNHPESVNDLIRYLEKYLGIKSKIEYYPMQEGDVIMTYANIDKLHALTCYTPQTKLEEGIRLFVSWFKWYRGKDHEN